MRQMKCAGVTVCGFREIARLSARPTVHGKLFWLKLFQGSEFQDHRSSHLIPVLTLNYTIVMSWHPSYAGRDTINLAEYTTSARWHFRVVNFQLREVRWHDL